MTDRLYVLSSADGRLSKVGRTAGDPAVRASSYEQRHGLVWSVFWSRPTLDVERVEQHAHQALAHLRYTGVPDAHEVFRCSPADAVAEIQRFIVAPGEAALTPRWAAYAEQLAAAAIPELVRLLTARLRRYRVGRQLLAAQSMLLRLLNALRP